MAAGTRGSDDHRKVPREAGLRREQQVQPEKTPEKASQPTHSGAKRRGLRAVFAADIAGFSGRMSLNEVGTVDLLNEVRNIGRDALHTHDGWLFGMAGDGLFATFESAVNAVRCALQVQSELAWREDLKALPLRIGIHLGEVLIEDDLPYGETLNIAARLEALAEPGGILVSGPVMDAVSSRISATFEDRGVPHLKNIPRRIPTYAVKSPPARSPADETRVGLSNLDRTTRLDRNALRDLVTTYGATDGKAGPSKNSPVKQVISADTAAPLEKTSPEELVLPENEAAPAARRLTKEFIDKIVKALSMHIGPLAKLIVERELKTNPTNFDLITRVEQHVPTEDERLAFRERASQINAASSALGPKT